MVHNKAKRMVEYGHDVIIFLASNTSLARAWNTECPQSGKTLPGGVGAHRHLPRHRWVERVGAGGVGGVHLGWPDDQLVGDGVVVDHPDVHERPLADHELLLPFVHARGSRTRLLDAACALQSHLCRLDDAQAGPARPVEEVDAVVAVDVMGPERHALHRGPAGRDEAGRPVAHRPPQHGRAGQVDGARRQDPQPGIASVLPARDVPGRHRHVRRRRGQAEPGDRVGRHRAVGGRPGVSAPGIDSAGWRTAPARSWSTR